MCIRWNIILYMCICGKIGAVVIRAPALCVVVCLAIVRSQQHVAPAGTRLLPVRGSCRYEGLAGKRLLPVRGPCRYLAETSPKPKSNAYTTHRPSFLTFPATIIASIVTTCLYYIKNSIVYRVYKYICVHIADVY